MALLTSLLASFALVLAATGLFGGIDGAPAVLAGIGLLPLGAALRRPRA
jgi:hypothetical protein